MYVISSNLKYSSPPNGLIFSITWFRKILLNEMNDLRAWNCLHAYLTICIQQKWTMWHAREIVLNVELYTAYRHRLKFRSLSNKKKLHLICHSYCVLYFTHFCLMIFWVYSMIHISQLFRFRIFFSENSMLMEP